MIKIVSDGNPMTTQVIYQTAQGWKRFPGVTSVHWHIAAKDQLAVVTLQLEMVPVELRARRVVFDHHMLPASWWMRLGFWWRNRPVGYFLHWRR